MKTQADIHPLHYATVAPDNAYAPILNMHLGRQIWNLMWLSFEFSKAGHAKLPNQQAILALTHTAWCDSRTGALLNPFVVPYERTVAFVLDQAPEVFVDWLNRVPGETRARLPASQSLGEIAWVSTVNRRLPMCNQEYDHICDVAQAQELLSRF